MPIRASSDSYCLLEREVSWEHVEGVNRWNNGHGNDRTSLITHRRPRAGHALSRFSVAGSSCSSLWHMRSLLALCLLFKRSSAKTHPQSLQEQFKLIEPF